MLTSKMDKNQISLNPEVDCEALLVQLKMFHQNIHPKSVYDDRRAITSMSPDMRSLFYQVEKLHRLLLVCRYFVPSGVLIQFSPLDENLAPKHHGTTADKFNGNIPRT